MMKPLLDVRRLLGLLVLAAVACTANAASEIPRSLAQFQHTTWTARDGVFGPIFHMAQTADGFLWLATGQGLQRFDGARFEHVQRLDGQDIGTDAIHNLFPTPTGGFWFYGYHGVGHVEGGRLKYFDKKKLRGMTSATTTSDGLTWLTTITYETYVVDRHDVLTRIDGTRGLPEQARLADSLVDREGTLWLAGGSSVYRLPRGESTIRAFTVDRGGKLVLAPDGAIWIYGDSYVIVVPPRAETFAQARVLPAPGFETMMFDRAGGLWTMTARAGAPKGTYLLQHFSDWKDFLRPGGVVDYRDVMGDKDGLSGTAIRAIIEDRDGNVWAGSNTGLDRFRSAPFVPLPLPGAPVLSSIAPAPEAGVWSVSHHQGMLRADNRSVTPVPLEPNPKANLVFREARGRLWVAGPFGVWNTGADGRLAHVSDSPFGKDGAYPLSIATDGSGQSWMSSYTGLVRWSGDAWEPQRFDIDPGSRVAAVHTDSRGRIWLAMVGGGAALLEGGSTRVLWANARDIGSIGVTHEREGRLWFGALHGAGLLEEKGKRLLRAADGLGFEHITGIRELASGELWLQAIDHVVRIPAEELRRWLADPSYAVSVQRYGIRDGLDGTTGGLTFGSTMAEAEDGRLWFSTSAGLYRLDVDRIAAPTRAPNVLIESLHVDGYARPLGAELKLPALAGRLSFAFTAAELGQPERVRFRYRIDGVDAGWQDAGTARSADYTGLAPGNYRFRVAARVGDGPWGEAGDGTVFSIEPAWFQTTLFRAACLLGFVALSLGAGWLVYALRAHRLIERARLRFEAQQGERERIARDLHDTLLQDTQGLILHFGAATTSLAPTQGELRERLQTTLDSAQQALQEMRDRVLDLRSQRESATLPLNEALGREVLQVNSARPVDYTVRVTGTSQDLRPEAQEALYRGAREAVLNAFAHADARRIDLSIRFARDVVEVVVRDNGRGIPEDILATGGRPGHWGLPGIRERITSLGGRVEFASEAAGGTRVEISLPARVAYPSESWWRRLLRSALRPSAAAGVQAP